MYQPDFPSVPFRLGLYPVVDSVAWIERLLAAGVRTLQLRIKNKRDSDVEDDVVAAIALGRKYHARLFINDYWRLAIKHQAYGVHLGQEDLETTDLAPSATPDCALAFPPMTIWKWISRWRRVPLTSRLVTFFRHKPSRCLPPLRGWISWRSIFSDWRIIQPWRLAASALSALRQYWPPASAALR